ncbi:hypothetical protein FACS1894139_16750 [Planctomycetales bacterium]|nr:hypothetical protein FACS1894107_12610 [Planctomycetales bacterium]GHS98742.1 hypothetical protein FACS1894108_07450 [Planctomycetales bacterium]GHT07846.1 hypothetical protein FACS1894139_16750 [Planctomycetales bacterium]
MDSANVYQHIPTPNLLKMVGVLRDMIRKFLVEEEKYPDDLKFDISLLDLIDIVVRVDQRVDYFKFFHQEMKVNEAKRFGLFVYWIVRLRPIRIVDDRYRIYPNSSRVNERFALHFLTAGLRKLERHQSLVNDKCLQGMLLHSLRYRSITLDAMMVLADSIR